VEEDLRVLKGFGMMKTRKALRSNGKLQEVSALKVGNNEGSQ
jgi:hypothetical protein